MIHAVKTRQKKTAVVNPQPKKKAKAHGKKKHKKAAKQHQAQPAAKASNPGTTMVLGYLNPKKATMAKTKTKKKHNPAAKKQKKRHNPDGKLEGLLMKPVQILYMGMLAAVGFLLTRQLPQFALKEKNKGLLGYAANLLTAGLAGGAAYKWIGPVEGTASLIGGSLYVFNRLVSEQTPLGKQLALSGVGDVSASGSLGALVAAYFPYPVVTDATGRPVIPKAIIDAVKAALPAAPPAVSAGPANGVAGIPLGVGRFASRFA